MLGAKHTCFDMSFGGPAADVKPPDDDPLPADFPFLGHRNLPLGDFDNFDPPGERLNLRPDGDLLPLFR